MEIEVFEIAPVCTCGRSMEVVTDEFGFEILICMVCSYPIEVIAQFTYDDDWI